MCVIGRVSMPDFVQVEREVTHESSYDSYLLAEELAKSVSSDCSGTDGASTSGVAERKITEVLTTMEREASSLRLSAAMSPSR